MVENVDMPEKANLYLVLSAVGDRLRRIRTERRFTLAEVADAIGISVSTLSRLESGQRKPQLELLLPLAEHYGVPLDDLVGAPALGDPRVHIRPLQRFGQIILPLSREGSGINVYKHVLPGKSKPAKPTPQGHAGYEWLYVIDGELRLILGGHEFFLSPGEAAEFDTRTPHWFDAAGPQAVEMLSLFSQEGKHVHLNDLA